MSSKKDVSCRAPAPGLDANASLEVLARRYSRALAQFFRRRVANQADVPDMVQDVFLRLSKLKDFSAIQHPEQYVFQTASSALRDQARRDITRQRRSHDEYDEAVHGASELCPERVLSGRQDVERLRSAIARLPTRTRDVFIFRVFEEMRMAEIAEALGISQRSVEKHYAKGLAAVAEAMRSDRDD